MKKIIILYMPVLHKGYLQFLKKYRDAEILYLPNQKLINEFMPVAKEIRQIDPEKMRAMIESAGLHHCVKILEREETATIYQYINRSRIVTANDSVSLGIVDKYFPKTKRTVDTIFLRWDEKNIHTKKPTDYGRVSIKKLDREMMSAAEKEAKKSSCWWRRVGAILVKDNKIISKAHSHHLPSEHTHYVFGDPRDFVEAGKNNEIATTIHAEQTIIAEAAKNGTAMEGLSLYMTDFPCPMCAKLLAYSGIKKCYFKKGHASLNGAEILRAKKIQLILVK
ncbi:MAG: deaminase [Candidatus Paceibacterota bacterium]